MYKHVFDGFLKNKLQINGKKVFVWVKNVYKFAILS